jgi:uncharacterized membrane protein YczE
LARYWEKVPPPENNSQAAEVAMKNALVDLVIYIVLIGLFCGLSLWLLDQVGSRIPERFYRVARIAIIVVAISLIISVLLSLVDRGPPHLKSGEMPWLMQV